MDVIQRDHERTQRSDLILINVRYYENKLNRAQCGNEVRSISGRNVIFENYTLTYKRANGDGTNINT